MTKLQNPIANFLDVGSFLCLDFGVWIRESPIFDWGFWLCQAMCINWPTFEGIQSHQRNRVAEFERWRKIIEHQFKQGSNHGLTLPLILLHFAWDPQKIAIAGIRQGFQFCLAGFSAGEHELKALQSFFSFKALLCQAWSWQALTACGNLNPQCA